ncbi:MAG: glucose-6-phosphate isomerase [Opitutales bacterium]|nr:glucose-6-phosphate isomerase [Opitutales bacterium]
MNTWNTFDSRFVYYSELGLSLDLSRVSYPERFMSEMEPRMQAAFGAMRELEAGAIANPDENRMVGHYWLRNPAVAPSAELSKEIQDTVDRIETLVARVHKKELKGQGGAFRNLLVIGIGGSALGPQFVSQALQDPSGDPMKVHFFDNTDPDGIDLVLSELRPVLGQTLCLVISKSGGTPETRNGMLEAEYAYQKAGLDFGKHAIAVTGVGSKLDTYAISNGWLDRFPMWDWVGGRTSELGPVGLLPAALQGIQIRRMLAGASSMDELTRSPVTARNPAALMALMWYYLTDGRGSKDMVVLPYKDRLVLFSKYLQQLIMESIGKELDLDGRVVNQGIAVYGNKGSTDQHAYVQQLREGLHNFFVVFIEVLREREGFSVDVEPATTSGDFLQGFYLGTRDALFEKGRESITITARQVDPETVGALIALFERAVGFYAHLVNINAYHQPGVEAGKKAASSVLNLKKQVDDCMKSRKGTFLDAQTIADAIGQPESSELVYKILVARVVNYPDSFNVEDIERPSKARFCFVD